MNLYQMFRYPARVLMELDEPIRSKDIKKCLNIEFSSALKIRKILVNHGIITQQFEGEMYNKKFILTPKGKIISNHFKKIGGALKWKN